MTTPPFPVRALAAGEAAPIVAVLMGGPSREHDISLKTGGAIAKALRESGWPVHEIVFRDAELPAIPADTQVVFPALHGAFGEDGQVQTLLEDAALPYVGSGPAASARMIDKQATKDHLAACGVPVPIGRVIADREAPPPPDMALPLIVKPNREGSTDGLALVRLQSQWRPALADALTYGGVALVEEFLVGVEATVGLVDGRALPVVEIRPPGAIYTRDAKYVYKDGKTAYFCPPERLDAATQATMRQLAEAAWTALDARDMLRVDFRLDAAGQPRVLEVNNIPGFTATSLLPQAAAASGLSFTALCHHLLLSALARG
jgi:D-alanine-D-alanine ligase